MNKKCKNCANIYEYNEEKCPKCGKKQYELVSKNRGWGSTIFVFIVLIAMIIELISCTAGDGSSKNNAEDYVKYDSCREKSNTYFKCSYSVWEDRCVCKMR